MFSELPQLADIVGDAGRRRISQNGSSAVEAPRAALSELPECALRITHDEWTAIRQLLPTNATEWLVYLTDVSSTACGRVHYGEIWGSFTRYTTSCKRQRCATMPSSRPPSEWGTIYSLSAICLAAR